MCYVPFSSADQILLIEIGLDFSKEMTGSAGDPMLFEISIGEGKAFLGGPSSNFRGKHVPLFYRCSEKGDSCCNDCCYSSRDGRPSTFDRTEGLLHLMMLDGRVSRANVDLIECASN